MATEYQDFSSLVTKTKPESDYGALPVFYDKSGKDMRANASAVAVAIFVVTFIIFVVFLMLATTAKEKTVGLLAEQKIPYQKKADTYYPIAWTFLGVSGASGLAAAGLYFSS